MFHLGTFETRTEEEDGQGGRIEKDKSKRRKTAQDNATFGGQRAKCFNILDICYEGVFYFGKEAVSLRRKLK